MELLRPYKLHEKQLGPFQCTKRFINLLCGRRGGKTQLNARLFILRAYYDLSNATGTPPVIINGNPEGEPLIHLWAIAPTNDLVKVSKRAFFSAINPKLILRHNRAENSVWLIGWILVEFKSADRPELLVAAGLHGIWISEYSRLKEWVWAENLRPTLTDHDGWALIDTTGKLMGNNHYERDILQYALPGPKHDPDFAHFSWNTEDNTFIPNVKEEVAKAKATLPEAIFNINYMASIESFEGAIWALKRETHWIKELPKTVDRITGGQDWGYSHDGAMVIVAQSGENYYIVAGWMENKLYVKDDPELHSWVKVYAEIDDWCFDQWGERIEIIAGGPDEPASIDAMVESEVPMIAADNSVSDGNQGVAILFHPIPKKGPRMYFVENTPYKEHLERIFKQCQKYHVKPGTDKPEKKDDDGPDALRYNIQTFINQPDMFEVT